MTSPGERKHYPMFSIDHSPSLELGGNITMMPTFSSKQCHTTARADAE
jgi:hypothetical protein